MYHQPAHRQQQREHNFQPRSLPNTTAVLNKGPLPALVSQVPLVRNAHLDSDRVLPPLATSSDGSKFVPFWKRSQHVSATATQQVIQQQTAQPPKKKWLTQAEMGMVSPAVIPLPLPNARTTTTTTTTTNTSTTTNNNVGTTVSSSGSGITASRVSGRTFNYNYNNYNHHVHQFNQPPNTKPAPTGPAELHHNGPGYVNRAGKPMPSAWQARAPGAQPTRRDDGDKDGEDEESTSQQDESEEDELSSSSPGPQYGILDLPSRRHRRVHSHQTNEPPTKPHVKSKNKKIIYQDLGLPTPPSVLVLQTPNNRRSGDYTPAYAYEYSLKYDQEGRHSQVERKKGHQSRQKLEETEEGEDSEDSEEEDEGSSRLPKKKKKKVKGGNKKWERTEETEESEDSEEEDEEGSRLPKKKKKAKCGNKKWAKTEESEESEESEEEDEESSPVPKKKKKKKKVKGGERKIAKIKNTKTKSKGKGTPLGKNRSAGGQKSRDEEESEEEDEVSDDEENERRRLSTLPKLDKTQNMSMSLQFASFGINDNHANHRGNPQHRLSRSEDYTRQPQSIFSASSRNTPTDILNKWPSDLPRLPRTPGTPADAVSNTGSSHNASGFASESPTKQHNSYFDYQPHQERRDPQINSRSQPHWSGGGISTTTFTNSSTPASSYSTYATSYTSMSDQGRPRDRRHMNLDDPPPSSLRRTPSPGYSSSSHSQTRSLPHVGVNGPSSSVSMSASSSSSQTNDQIRSLVEQPRIQDHHRPQISQAHPQPPEPARRYTHGPSGFHASYAFWQQQQAQQPLHPSPQPPHRAISTTSGSGSSIIGGSSGAPNGYGNVQTSVPGPVPALQTLSSSRRRELPPQPAQGHGRAQEILREAMERQNRGHNPSPPQSQPPQQPQPQHQSRQSYSTSQSGTSVPASFSPQVQRRQPLPQPSLLQQQSQARQPPPHPRQYTQPPPSVQQYRQTLVQQPQRPLPQPLPQQQSPPQQQPLPPRQPLSPPQQPLPRQPLPPQQPLSPRQPLPPQQPLSPRQPLPPQQTLPQQPRPQQPLPPQHPQPLRQQQQPQPHPLPQPPIHQQQRQQTHGAGPRQQPPQAQRNVYRRPSMPVESPFPVGGRDKVADIPRMGKAASVVDSTSGYGSGGSISASESEAESLQSASQRVDETSSDDANMNAVPGIVINVPVNRSSSKASSLTSSPQTPVIHVQEEEEAPQRQTPSTPVPQLVVDVPGISFTSPEDGGGGPSISVSAAPDDKPQPRPKSQPAPKVSTPQQRARSVPAFATVGGNATALRNQPGLSCGGCGGSIMGRIVNAMGARWHPECFRCTACDMLLEHVSSYEHDGKPYCHLDYHENFAPRCYQCKTAIIEERFISLDDPALGKRTYHEPHFFCAECGDPFLTPSSSDFEKGEQWSGELALSGDGEFESDNVGFTVYRGHPYCESCHVRLRLPKCKRCKKSIRDGDRAVEALGGKWCWSCFVCESCQKPFEEPAFFQRAEKPYCEPCFSVMLRNEV